MQQQRLLQLTQKLRLKINTTAEYLEYLKLNAVLQQQKQLH